METLITFVKEYRKAIGSAVVGALIFLVKTYVPEMFTPELSIAFDTIVGAIITLLIGYFTRISRTEAKVLHDLENNNV